MNDRTCTSVPGGRVSRLSAGRRGAHRLCFALSKADFMSLCMEAWSVSPGRTGPGVASAWLLELVTAARLRILPFTLLFMSCQLAWVSNEASRPPSEAGSAVA